MSPDSSKKSIKMLSEEIKKKNNKIQALRMQNCRLNKKYSKLEEVLDNLRDSNYLSDGANSTLQVQLIFCSVEYSMFSKI